MNTENTGETVKHLNLYSFQYLVAPECINTHYAKSTNISLFAQIMTDTDMALRDWDCQNVEMHSQKKPMPDKSHKGLAFTELRPSSTERTTQYSLSTQRNGNTKYTKEMKTLHTTLRSKFMPKRLTCKYLTLLNPPQSVGGSPWELKVASSSMVGLDKVSEALRWYGTAIVAKNKLKIVNSEGCSSPQMWGAGHKYWF